MPVYEYRCNDCGKNYEALQPADASRTESCEECGGLANRILSTFSINSSSGRNLTVDLVKSGDFSCNINNAEIHATYKIYNIKQEKPSTDSN